MQNKKLIVGSGIDYSIYKSESMDFLRAVFPDGIANEMNFCIFSTSGVHGSYKTIEQDEKELRLNEDGERDDDWGITFLLIQPRLVVMIYGVVYPESPDDFEFLKRLRQSSWDAVNSIGRFK